MSTRRFEIHASIVATSANGRVSTEHVLLEIEALSLPAAIRHARLELQQPLASVFIDHDLCREVRAA